MKNKILLIISLLIIVILTGCYRPHREDVIFQEVKFFDEENNEIKGEYKNYFHRNFDIGLNNHSSIMLLNSPAPVVNFYRAEVLEGSSVKVEMVFKIKDNMPFATIALMGQDDRTNIIDKMDKVEIVDNYAYLTILIENINQENNLFEALYWIDNEGNKLWFSERGGNTYLRGFYFKVTYNNDVPN